MYLPNGLSGPNSDASMSEFKKTLPYDLNKFEFTDVETGVSQFSHEYSKLVRVWHYIQLLHIVIRDIPCYASASEGENATITKKDKSQVARAISDVYQELLTCLSHDVLDLIVLFGSTPQATWHVFTAAPLGEGLRHYSTYTFSVYNASFSE